MTRANSLIRISFSLFLFRIIGADASQQGYSNAMYGGNYKPSILLPNPNCQNRVIDGKMVVSGNANPSQCMQNIMQKAEERKKRVITGALQGIEQALKQPEKEPECVSTVDIKALNCQRRRNEEKRRKSPKYMIVNNSNWVRILSKPDNKLVLSAVSIITHFKKIIKPCKPDEVVTKHRGVIVLNEDGDIVASKNPKPIKTPPCVCPTKSEIVKTTESLQSSCIKKSCNAAGGILSGMIQNATVTTELAEDEKEEGKGKDKDKESKEEGKEAK